MADETATLTNEPIIRANKGQFQPGQGGRPHGAVNHLTKTVKETVLAVFNDLQSDPEAKLEAWAKREPTEFYRIAAKLIPTEMTGSVKQVIIVTDQDE